MSRNLASFRNPSGQSITTKFRLGIWMLLQTSLIGRVFCPSGIRIFFLRLFGAKIGSGVLIRRGIRVHMPWNLVVGDDCWLGEDVWFISHEKIVIGNDVCISQRSIISSGGHDYRSASLAFKHSPIAIAEGAWVCLDAKVLPGAVIGRCSVIAAGEVARGVIPDYSMLIGGLIRQIDPPK